MPWDNHPLSSLSLPQTAGPNDPHMYIGIPLPPPIDTYLFAGSQLFVAGIVWFRDANNFTFLCLATFPGSIDLVLGHVIGGVVQEVSAGQPKGQRWEMLNSGDITHSIRQSNTDPQDVLFIGESSTDFMFALAGGELNLSLDQKISAAPGGLGAYVSLGRGVRDVTSQTGSSAAIGAEAIIETISSFVYRDGRAYEVNLGGRLSTSAANTAILQLRRTNLAGAILSTFGGFTFAAATVGWPLTQRTVLRRTAGSGDLTETLVCTLQASAGTATHLGAGGRPRFLEIRDIGAAADHPQGVSV